MPASGPWPNTFTCPGLGFFISKEIGTQGEAWRLPQGQGCNNSSKQVGMLHGGGGSKLGLQDEQDSEGGERKKHIPGPRQGKSKQKPGGGVSRPARLP